MARCEVCGNEYDKAFQVSMPGGASHTFDSFECAIARLAPTCPTCSSRVLGKGIVGDGQIYCSRHCAGGGSVTEGWLDN